MPPPLAAVELLQQGVGRADVGIPPAARRGDPRQERVVEVEPIEFQVRPADLDADRLGLQRRRPEPGLDEDLERPGLPGFDAPS
ncbi:MAG: hypothetical protein U0790_25885 [Isosphaeraceae bacterium]